MPGRHGISDMAVQAGRTFRVFVSSTFSDLKAERDALQRFVFPRLRELCLRHSCRFQAIDLRWGVRDEAALDQQTMRICLDEIARCQRTTPRPNFVILLGDRYGWRPLPWRIPADEMEALRPHFGSPEDAALIEDWYRRDDNAVPPAFVLRPRVLPPTAKGARTTEVREAEAADWGRTERRLQEILRSALAHLRFDDAEREKYLASATEQEITRGAMAAKGAEDHVFAFLRVIPKLSGTPLNPAAKDFLDTLEKNEGFVVDEEARRLQIELRDFKVPGRLPRNIHRYEAPWTDNGLSTDHIGSLPENLDSCLAMNPEDPAPHTLCRDVWKRLSTVILSEVAAIEAVRPLDKEIKAHKVFGLDRRRLFVGRTAALKTVADYLASDERTPLAVFGPSGSGKSAFLAEAAEKARLSYPPDSIITRFIGATPDSTNGRLLLEGICHEIAQLCSQPLIAAGTEFRELIREFSRLLDLSSQTGRLLVVIDALDQLSDAENARALLWLPDELPANVKIIVSALPGDCARALERRLLDIKRLALEPMVASEGAALLDSWLAEAGRTLQPDQRSMVLDRFAVEGRPLFLKLAFDYALHWPSYKAAETIALGTDIAGLLNGLFDRLSADSNHGPTIVSRSLGFLAAAKNGLSEDELLDILSRDQAVYADFIERAHHEPPEKRLPVVVWSRLYFDLESHLAERTADGASLFTFYHRQFAEAAHARFLAGEAGVERHGGLAGYFTGLPLYMEKGPEAAPHLRKLAELPFQQIHGGLWKDIPGTLADFGFLQAKVEAGYLDDAIGDFETLKREFPVPESPSKDSFRELRTLLTAFSSAFNQEFHFFRDSPRTTAQQLYSNLYAHVAFDGPVGAVLKTYYERGGDRDDRPWLRRLNRAPRTSLSRDLLRTIDAHENAVTALAISPAGDFLATGSVDGTVRVWKERDGTQQAGLSAHIGGVTALRFIPGSPDSPLLASGGRDGFIRIWDWRIEVQVSAWKAHNGRVRCLLALGDGDRLASCGDDPVIKLWSRATGARISELRSHKDRVFGLAGNPTGTVLVSGGEDRTLKYWLVDRPGDPKTLRGHEKSIRSVGLATDLKWAASGSDDGCLKTWGLETGRERHSVEAHRRRLNDIAVGPATGRIATAGEDATVKIWDAGTLELLMTFLGHSGAVQSLAFGPQEGWLASAGADGTLRLWGLGAGRKKDEVSWEHEGTILCISQDEVRGIVATAGEDTTIRIWDQRQGDHQTTLRGHLGPVHAVLPLNKDTLVSASGDRTIKIWEIPSSKLVRTLGQPLSGAMAAVTSAAGATPFSTDMKGGHSGPVTCLGRISDNLIISGSRDGTLRLWEVAEGKEVRLFEGKTGPVDALAVEPDRRLVISAGTSPDLLVWDLDTSKARIVWKGHSGNVTCLAIPPGSSHVISGSLDRSVGVWSLADGQCRMLPGHKDRINAVAFDPGRGLIASAGQDASVRLWDAESGKSLGILAGHRAPVRAIFLDGGAGLIISGGDDGFVYVWQIEGARLLARIGLGAPVTAVRSLTERMIIAGMKNGGVVFLKLEIGASGPDDPHPSPVSIPY